MAIIPMTSGFTLCPKGVQVFRIYKVDYNEEFGKLTIHLVNAQGITHKENYSLMGAEDKLHIDVFPGKHAVCGRKSFDWLSE